MKWRNKECEKQAAIIFADPTANWGDTPSTATQEVGWLVSRNKELITRRIHNQVINPIPPRPRQLDPIEGWSGLRREKEGEGEEPHNTHSPRPRLHNQAKWTQSKNSCAETLYADEYAKFGA